MKSKPSVSGAESADQSSHVARSEAEGSSALVEMDDVASSPCLSRNRRSAASGSPRTKKHRTFPGGCHSLPSPSSSCHAPNQLPVAPSLDAFFAPGGYKLYSPSREWFFSFSDSFN